MQAAPPPASPPAAVQPSPTPPSPTAPSVVRGASANTVVAFDDRKLVLTKGQRTETALARYQIFLKTDVDRKVPAAQVQSVQVQNAQVETAAPPKVQCGWRIQAYLQHTTCFWSMTGLFSCTDMVSEELPDSETGAADLDPAQPAEACSLSFAPAREARDRLAARLTAGATARFDADYQLKLRPLLAASGVQVKRAP